MTDTDDLTPEQRFAVHINQAMAIALEDDADPDAIAKISANTARELYDHYGAGEDHANFLELVVDASFEAAEAEEWLDIIEGRVPPEDE